MSLGDFNENKHFGTKMFLKHTDFQNYTIARIPCDFFCYFLK